MPTTQAKAANPIFFYGRLLIHLIRKITNKIGTASTQISASTIKTISIYIPPFHRQFIPFGTSLSSKPHIRHIGKLHVRQYPV
jgi:hypothetical protein